MYFSLTETGFQLDAEERVFERAERTIKGFDTHVAQGVALEALAFDDPVQEAPGTMGLAFDLTCVETTQNSRKRDLQLRCMTEVLCAVGSIVEPRESDPGMKDFGMGVTRKPSTGRLNLYGTVLLTPEIPDEVITDQVNDHMRTAAWLLGLDEGDVNVRVSWQHGVILEVDRATGCGVYTEGTEYVPDVSDPWAELSAGNLYSPDQQIVCFTGMIAIARASKPLSPQS